MAYGTMSIGNAGFTKKFISILFLLMHPVGTPYASEKPTSPAELYGGTWERIEGQFIIGASDTYPAGSTGGEAAVSLTAANNGPHKHETLIVNYNSGDLTVPTNEWRLVYKDPGAATSFLMSSQYSLQESGQGQPHNNIPPYYSMYIWRRVS